MSEVEFRVLGAIEALRDGVRLPLGGPRPRTVLATLLLADGRWVRVDAIVHAVWKDDAPATATKTVQKYISHLRATLGDPGLIVSRPDGYELVTDHVDSRQFERLIDQAAAQADQRVAVQLLEQALALWQGEPYGDLPELAPAEAERRRLVERRLQAIESLVDARLALGQHAQVTGWLEELVAEHPLRERLWGSLMLALYRSGRQADALAAYGGCARGWWRSWAPSRRRRCARSMSWSCGSRIGRLNRSSRQPRRPSPSTHRIRSVDMSRSDPVRCRPG